MQLIRLLLKQETRNNRSGARGFKKMGELVIKLARDRDRDSKNITQTSAMKRSEGTLVTGVKQVLGIWVEYFKKLVNPEGEYEIELPHSVRRESWR